MTNDLKYCSKCGVGKPASEEYFPMRSDVGKLNAQCRECKTKKRREQYLRNRESLLIKGREWKANNKERRKEVHKKWYTENKERILQHSRDMYHENLEAERLRNKKYRDAHKEDRNEKRKKRYALNPEKENDQARDWYKTNKEKHLNNGREWRRNNKDKVVAILEKYRSNKLSNGGVYSERDVKRMYSRQRGRCSYCDCNLGSKYHIDHVIPLSKGGSNYCGNIVLACPSCNSSKGNKLPIEWKVYKLKVA